MKFLQSILSCLKTSKDLQPQQTSLPQELDAIQMAQVAGGLPYAPPSTAIVQPALPSVED